MDATCSPPPAPAPGRGTVIFAGPDYDAAGCGGRQTGPQDQADRDSPPPRNERALHITPLPGTTAEAAAVKGALQEGPYGPVSVFLGRNATETKFKALPAPRVLHIATHGFFFPTSKPALEGRGPAPGSGRHEERRVEAPPRAEDPLLRSGLILAGANALDAPPGQRRG